MELALERDTSHEMPMPDHPTEVRRARIWHCKYRSLARLAELTNLEELEVATFPDESLQPLAGLSALRRLRIVHMPKIRDLAPLGQLRELRELSLATLPSWDASGKVTEIESLAPITSLPALQDVELFGVLPRDRSVKPLLDMSSLRRLRVSQFPKDEVERVRAAFPPN